MRMCRTKSMLVIAACLGGIRVALCFAGRPNQDERETAIANEKIDFQKQVVPLLEKYCTECHGGAKKKAGLALDVFKGQAEAAATSDRELWVKVLEKLDAREMPPEDRAQPSQN